MVIPTTPEDAKGLLLESIFDPNPVVFIEHRWLHGGRGSVPQGDYRIPIGKARVIRPGADITIVSLSYLTVEAMEAAKALSRDHGIETEVIDLRSARPIDWSAVLSSVARTGRLLALDTGFTTGSVAGEIVARTSMELFDRLKGSPRRLAMPDVSEPTSVALTGGFYVGARQIVDCVAEMLGRPVSHLDIPTAQGFKSHDIPGPWFSGPF